VNRLISTGCAKKFLKKPKINSKKKILIRGRTPPPSARPSPSQVAQFFAQKSRATHSRWDSNPRPRPRAKPPLPLHHTLTCVHIPFRFPTYYTNTCVICLLEVLNDFKSKSCQLQSFITFRDEQLSYWSFLHPRSFTKFEFKI
jgi:hypothetical protein